MQDNPPVHSGRIFQWSKSIWTPIGLFSPVDSSGLQSTSVIGNLGINWLWKKWTGVQWSPVESIWNMRGTVKTSWNDIKSNNEKMSVVNELYCQKCQKKNTCTQVFLSLTSGLWWVLRTFCASVLLHFFDVLLGDWWGVSGTLIMMWHWCGRCGRCLDNPCDCMDWG